MIALLRFFAARHLSATGIAMAAGSVLVALINALGASAIAAGGIIVMAGYLLPFYLYFSAIPMNLPWVMTLPIRKRSILLSQAILSALTGLLTILVITCLLAVHALTSSEGRSSGIRSWLEPADGPGKVQDLPFLAKAASALEAALEWNPLTLQNALLGLTAAAVGLLFVAPRQLPGTMRRNPQFRAAPVAGILAAAAAAYSLRSHLDTPLVTAAVLTVIGGVALRSTLVRVAFPLPRRRAWLAAYAGWGALELGLCALVAVIGLSSANPRLRANSVLYLGPWSGQYGRESLASLLAEDLHEEQIRKIGDALRERHFMGSRVPGPRELGMEWEGAIRAKKRVDALDAFVALFDARALEPAMLRAFLERRSELAPDDPPGAGSLRFFPKGFTSRDAAAFLRSGKPHLARFALVWSRYHGDSAALAAILEAFGSLGDEEKLIAVETLSLLTGERLTLGRVTEPRFRKAARALDPARCSELQPLPAQEGLLNFCVRRRWPKIRGTLDLHLPERAGWIDFPLDAREKALVQALLRH